MVPIGVLASGRGSNLDAVLDAVENHYLTKCEVKIVISNRPNAPAIEVAKKHHVETITLDDKGVPKKNWDYDQKTVAALQSRGVAPKTGLIVLAGYLRILSEQFVDLYTRRILQTPVAIRDDDTAESLSDRILREEHRILPEAIRLLTEDQLKLEGRRILFKN